MNVNEVLQKRNANVRGHPIEGIFLLQKVMDTEALFLLNFRLILASVNS